MIIKRKLKNQKRRFCKEMQAKYEVEFEVTSKHKKRQKNDMQTEFRLVVSGVDVSQGCNRF